MDLKPNKNQKGELRVAEIAARFSLAFVFFWAGFGSLNEPNQWIGFLPFWLTNFIPQIYFLKIFSFFEILLGLWLLSGWQLKIAAFLSGLTFFLIIIFNLPSFDIIFRDIMGIGLATVLFILTNKKNCCENS